MPLDPPDPGVTAAFLLDLVACTYSGGQIHDASGAVKKLHAPTGNWALSSTGLRLSSVDFTALCAGTANLDGSVTIGGVVYRLHEVGGRSSFAELVVS